MPTINQLVRIGRSPRKEGTPLVSLGGVPQRRATCLKVTVANPCKPNSAERAIARVRMSHGIEATVFIPGESHTLQEHNTVLIRGGGPKDLSGVNFSVVRGVYDCGGVKGRDASRSTSRSRYGLKRPKKGVASGPVVKGAATKKGK